MAGRAPSDRPTHRFGLVLSGGGARGAAHVALLEALAVRNVLPTALAGTSAGALVAAMQACGIPPSRMLDFFRKTVLFRWQNLALGRRAGLLDSDKILLSLLPLFGDRRIEDLDTELSIATTDLQSGRQRLITSGSVARAVMASSAVPGVMSPVEIDGRLHADGGLIDLLPTDALRESCLLLAASYVNAIEEIGPELLGGALAVLQRAFQISGSSVALWRLQSCDICFAPAAISAVGLFELERTDEVHAASRQAAIEVAEAIAERLRA